jgi:hypothetical protein
MRLSDIQSYFAKNYDMIKPRRAIIYVDNVPLSLQGEIPPWIKDTIAKQVEPKYEVRTGNWTDRTLCLMQLLSDLKNDSDFHSLLIMDSDNVIEPEIQSIDNELETKDLEYYTLLDRTCRIKSIFVDRSVPKGSVDIAGQKIQISDYHIGGTWKGIFFLGPKQGMRMSKKFIDSLNEETISAVTSAMKEVHPRLRLYVTDETSLGMVAYYSGVRSTPWIELGTHYQRTFANEREDVLLTAMAHSLFGRKMMKYYKGSRIRWYYLRNKISLIGRTILT